MFINHIYNNIHNTCVYYLRDQSSSVIKIGLRHIYKCIRQIINTALNNLLFINKACLTLKFLPLHIPSHPVQCQASAQNLLPPHWIAPAGLDSNVIHLWSICACSSDCFTTGILQCGCRWQVLFYQHMVEEHSGADCAVNILVKMHTGLERNQFVCRN